MKNKYIDPITKKEWICSNCGGKWMEGSTSCPYSHSPLTSQLRPEYQPRLKKLKRNNKEAGFANQ